MLRRTDMRGSRKVERTLAIIKPDAVSKGLIGAVVKRLEDNGFRILALKMFKLTKPEAEGFYYVHKSRPFFDSLTDFMSSGPIIPILLERENAIRTLRELMGTTNPKDASKGTIRGDLGSNIEQNIIHGSDSEESARFEISYFFSSLETLNKG